MSVSEGLEMENDCLRIFQIGATKCLLNTMNAFHPIQFVEIWREYNILEICMELLTSNYSTGTDLGCQIDLLTISSHLLAGNFDDTAEAIYLCNRSHKCMLFFCNFQRLC